MLWVYGHYKYFTLSVRGSTLEGRLSKFGTRAERVEVYIVVFSRNPLLFYLNFQPLEVVSRYCDTQLQVAENYSYLVNLGSIV